jgi:tRNA-splicing ligase RtcB
MATCMKVGNVVAAAICADGHLGYAQPVGAVIAYEDQISISGVGFDIGCGNMAVRLDVAYDSVKDRAQDILQTIRSSISFGIGQVNESRAEHDLFDDASAWIDSGMEDYRQKARTQLGTVGSGNHYIDLFYDEFGMVWIGVHFGSRDLGHTTATRYLKLAGVRMASMFPQPLLMTRAKLDKKTSPEWNWRGAMPMQGVNGLLVASAKSSADK